MLKLYDGVPPDAFTLKEVVPPVLPIVPDVIEEAIAVGSPTEIETVSFVPVLSVIIYWCVPALTEKLPTPVYGALPPVAETVTKEEPPKHGIFAADASAIRGVVVILTICELDSNMPASGASKIAFPAKSLSSPTGVPKLIAVDPLGKAKSHVLTSPAVLVNKFKLELNISLECSVIPRAPDVIL